jgi:hypothetical protein
MQAPGTRNSNGLAGKTTPVQVCSFEVTSFIFRIHFIKSFAMR